MSPPIGTDRHRREATLFYICSDDDIGYKLTHLFVHTYIHAYIHNVCHVKTPYGALLSLLYSYGNNYTYIHCVSKQVVYHGSNLLTLLSTDPHSNIASPRKETPVTKNGIISFHTNFTFAGTQQRLL